MKAALLQLNIRRGEAEHNRNLARRHLEEAAAQGANIAVLPELWNCGYLLPELPRLAETLSGASVSLLREAAAKLGLFIFGGSIAEKKDGKFYNTSVAIDAKGEIVAKYRKAHLFQTGLREHDYFAAGDRWVLAETPWLKAGMILCYDVRFPEFCRNLVLRGAKMLVVPAQWPRTREAAWRALCTARAVENGCFVLAANRAGLDGLDYHGESMIISPRGEILGSLRDSEGLVLAELDPAMIEEERGEIRALAGRRRILDEIDDSQI
ncbi:MAG: carbon-nitrogen family hydrolase [Clostridiales bacterium]|nr:carbon-nitrogen family hydrolase [Clostridiales bacterium]